ncbi:DNA polymerase/3'-5' exonuclease PolX [Nitriliruptor alkaliphilus]|uniref:DNA polymerase/3'-5' exonuclease PolX n=1 Tax=Nitriliruptor alkaliphilus TaxID=427918 RepID=UPI0006991DAF|nr:DNA polymerase/3'-5' exonuclease PolX [Nitriliruptor alkaliphilus]
MARTNDEVARLLNELAVLTEIDESSPQAFRVRAYQNAARAVAGLSRDVAQMSASELADVRGLGKSTATKIREYVDTGTIGKLEQLRDKHPVGKRDLLKIPGLGPKGVELLSSELGVTDLDGLKAALADGRIAALPGMGEKTADNLREAVERSGLSSKEQRVPLVDALPIAERIVARLREVPGVVDAAYAGSARRYRDDVGDLDVLVASDDPDPVTEAFVSLPDVARTVGSGGTKTSIATHDGLGVDLRVVPPASFGAALVYFTGSKAHNIRLRQRALKRGWTLNEYALAELVDPPDDADAEAADEPAPAARTGDVVAAATEEDIYAALGLAWVPPELREDDGEVELAETGDLPDLVTREAIRGDLHDHTDLSGDGKDPLEAMVEGAVERGLDYLAITDHAEDLRINGVSKAAMLDQRRQLRDLEQRRGDITLLHGAELNIDIDGSLDYDAEFLATFDWLVASVHSHFRRPVAEQTARVVAAIRHPSVTAIGHLSGRMMGKRPGIELDIEQVLDAAAETGTAIEVNSNLRRKDATAEVIREGVRRGVTFVISTDAHSVRELDLVRHGVHHARRGGLTHERCANTWSTERFLAWRDDVRTAKR